jgi:cytoskeleton protein RodZ
LASFDIGARLRQERVGQGLTIDDIARDTRIAPRFLEAIEADDFTHFPGLVFTRSFVRQYALALKLDPDPLLAELPKQDESTVQLPDPPARPRSSYYRDRRLHSAFLSAAWLLIAGGASVAAWKQFNHSAPTPLAVRASEIPPTPVPAAPRPAPQPSSAVPASPVQVFMTAHEPAWVQVSADGKTTFTGILQSNETREISAAEQVKILTGNAGALTISLNGKTLEALGPAGQVRSVRLTAEGPQLLSKAPQSAPLDPL